MAMPQRDDWIEEIKRLDALLEYAVMHGDSPSGGKVPLFGAFKDKIKFIAPDFDEPLEDFAEYM